MKAKVRVNVSIDRGPAAYVWSGRQVHPFRLDAAEVHIDDIAHSLGRKCRFNGHCSAFYSVAEHSVYVSYAVPEAFALAGLLHDAAEAYSGDLWWPVKMLMREFILLEKRIQAVVLPVFGLSPTLPEVVKRADWAVLADEREQLMPKAGRSWELPEAPAGVTIECWGPEKAPQEFIKRFMELGGGQ